MLCVAVGFWCLVKRFENIKWILLNIKANFFYGPKRTFSLVSNWLLNCHYLQLATITSSACCSHSLPPSPKICCCWARKRDENWLQSLGLCMEYFVLWCKNVLLPNWPHALSYMLRMWSASTLSTFCEYCTIWKLTFFMEPKRKFSLVADYNWLQNCHYLWLQATSSACCSRSLSPYSLCLKICCCWVWRWDENWLQSLG